MKWSSPVKSMLFVVAALMSVFKTPFSKTQANEYVFFSNLRKKCTIDQKITNIGMQTAEPQMPA